MDSLQLVFTEKEIGEFQGFIDPIPFKLAYPIFSFMQNKISEAVNLEEHKKQQEKKTIEEKLKSNQEPDPIIDEEIKS